MSRARNIADLLDSSGDVKAANLDNVSSGGGGDGGWTYKSETITTSKVLDADTEYLTGKNLVIESGVTLTIPSSSDLLIKNWAAQAQL